VLKVRKSRNCFEQAVKKMRRQLKRAALQATYYSGAYRFISRRYSGIGTIFVIHKVVSKKTDSLATWLTITVDFLDRVLAHLKTRADFVRLDEVRERLAREEPVKVTRPFIALTFDDGFRDNLTLGLPVLRRHGVPAAVYVPSGAPDRNLDPWPWRLERAIRELSEVSLDLPDLPRRLSLQTFDEKQAASSLLTEHIHRNIPANRHLPESLLSKERVSDESLIAEQFASWDELRELASDRLVTIGGHTVTHASLRDLKEDQAMAEIDNGRRRLETQLDVAVSHFAYPYGASSNCGIREFALAARAGFVTGVTARDGNIFHEHRDHLMCLPRRGLCRSKEEISSPVLDLCGAPTALGSRWRDPLVTT
jgi:peptidoglycan/xylan/chitin deacetylase (PgdA/CDA1 family)